MQETKEISWANGYDGEPDAADDHAEVKEPAANEADGWQQYRKWISTAPAPRSRRSGVDPSLYTWKGYRSWSEQVKRNWSDS